MIYAVVECGEKEKIVDARSEREDAIISCACFNTKRSRSERYIVRCFDNTNFLNKLDVPQINDVYKMNVSYKTKEILKFTCLEYVFGDKNEIRVRNGRYYDYVQVIKTYPSLYYLDENRNYKVKDKIKSEMFKSACEYIDMILRQEMDVLNTIN